MLDSSRPRRAESNHDPHAERLAQWMRMAQALGVGDGVIDAARAAANRPALYRANDNVISIRTRSARSSPASASACVKHTAASTKPSSNSCTKPSRLNASARNGPAAAASMVSSRMPRLAGVTGGEGWLRRPDPALRGVAAESLRQIDQLGRCRWRSADCAQSRRPCPAPRGLWVAAGGSQRQMPGLQLGLLDDLGQAPVHAAALGWARRRCRRRGPTGDGRNVGGDPSIPMMPSLSASSSSSTTWSASAPWRARPTPPWVRRRRPRPAALHVTSAPRLADPGLHQPGEGARQLALRRVASPPIARANSSA